jgi:hypothetical protein
MGAVWIAAEPQALSKEAEPACASTPRRRASSASRAAILGREPNLDRLTATDRDIPPGR